jgi:hypothetical protein
MTDKKIMRKDPLLSMKSLKNITYVTFIYYV